MHAVHVAPSDFGGFESDFVLGAHHKMHLLRLSVFV